MKNPWSEPLNLHQHCSTTIPAQPTQLHFYHGCWVDVLKDAKDLYRHFIHTEEPFPEYSHDSLADAHGHLIDSIGKFQEEARLPLDEGLHDAVS